MQALEQQLLDRLAEQTSAEKGAQRTVRDTKALRVVIQQKEGQLQELQAQLARTQTDYDGTQVCGRAGQGHWHCTRMHCHLGRRWCGLA